MEKNEIYSNCSITLKKHYCKNYVEKSFKKFVKFQLNSPKTSTPLLFKVSEI